jgi:putative phosphoribosyl transferase
MSLPNLSTMANPAERLVDVRVSYFTLEGQLVLPRQAVGLVIFVHESGSRQSQASRFIAGALHSIGLATLTMDLLSPTEAAISRSLGDSKFDFALVADRLIGATDWLSQFPDTRLLHVGFLASHNCAAAALVAAAERPERVHAVVSHAGNPTLAGAVLRRVHAATLLLVGDDDEAAIRSNEAALEQLPSTRHLELIAGGDARLEIPEALDQVAAMARDWCEQHLVQRSVWLS